MHQPPHPQQSPESEKKFEVIEQPYDLKSKVGPDVGFSKEVLEQAEQAVENLNAIFTSSLKEDLKTLCDLVAAYAITPDIKILMKVVTKCHDLKGNCSTFDYYYITIVAGLLEDYITEFIRKPNPLVIDLYLTALNRLANDNIKGNGHPLGDTLIQHLKDLHTAERHKAKSAVAPSS